MTGWGFLSWIMKPCFMRHIHWIICSSLMLILFFFVQRKFVRIFVNHTCFMISLKLACTIRIYIKLSFICHIEAYVLIYLEWSIYLINDQDDILHCFYFVLLFFSLHNHIVLLKMKTKQNFELWKKNLVWVFNCSIKPWMIESKFVNRIN